MGWPKCERGCRKSGRDGSDFLFFVFLVVIVNRVVLIVRLLVLIVIVVIRDGVDLDRVNLYDFHFGFALKTGENFAFLDLVFIDINFSGAFRTPDHGEVLLGDSDALAAEVLYNAKRAGREAAKITMTLKREYPERPMIGVGGVLIDDARALLIRRASPPLQGQWSIPGGMLEVGETLEQGVARELAEETGLEVKVVELIEVFERIFPAPANADGSPGNVARPQYHFVILDYLCEKRGGEICAGSDALEFAWAREEELVKFDLTVAATRVLRKAFARARARAIS